MNAALQKVNSYLDKMYGNYYHDGVIVMEEHTLDEGDFYVFFYNTREYILTGNIASMLFGNGGLIVEKATLDMYQATTMHPIEYYIALFRENKSNLTKIAFQEVFGLVSGEMLLVHFAGS